MAGERIELLIRDALQHLAQGRPNDAIASASVVLSRDPQSADAHMIIGASLLRLRQYPKAIESYQRAAALRPGDADAHAALAGALRRVGRLDEASAAAERAVAADPNNGGAHANFGVILADQGRLTQAVESFRRAVQVWPHLIEAHSNLLYTSLFVDQSDCRELLREHREWAAKHADHLAPPALFRHANDPDPNRRLRIGYVSGDFRSHAVTRFMLPLLANHNRGKFEIHCYSNLPPAAGDGSTARVKSLADRWHDIAGVPDAALADAIRAQQIDILVDLSLHMAANRLLLFARKPAPVQVTYLGYAGTTGLKTIDYRITDALLDPPGEHDDCYIERSAYVASYWCYEAPAEAGEVDELPARRRGYITFGCLNNFRKVTPRALAAWAEILRRVDRSHIILHAAEGAHRSRITAMFQQHGIDADRIEFIPKQPMRDYLATHDRIDVALDPFPYNGGTTSCDGLWMGAPLVTLAGHTAVARAGVSLLSQIGLSDLIAADVEQYTECAVQLAQDRERLLALRTQMQSRMNQSPLMNAPAATRALESAFRQMWRTWCDCG